jgi:D-psicose/D-tagatose/L-ribulose 3-epimerase
VVYCIEPLAPVETALINTVEQGAAIVDEIGSPAVRTMIDCCAAGQSEAEPPDALIGRWLASGHIAHVHLNDPNRRGPGQGETRFAPILAALRRLDYRGICSIEPFVYEPDGPSCAARAIGYVRGILEALESQPA